MRYISALIAIITFVFISYNFYKKSNLDNKNKRFYKLIGISVFFMAVCIFLLHIVLPLLVD